MSNKIFLIISAELHRKGLKYLHIEDLQMFFIIASSLNANEHARFKTCRGLAGLVAICQVTSQSTVSDCQSQFSPCHWCTAVSVVPLVRW